MPWNTQQKETQDFQKLEAHDVQRATAIFDGVEKKIEKTTFLNSEFGTHGASTQDVQRATALYDGAENSF